MSVKMILITDNRAHIQNGQSIARQNGYLFQSYSIKKWDLIKELESQLKEDKEISAKIIPLPTGHTPMSSLQKVENDMIEKVLISCNGNASKAAKILRIGRATLYRKIERLGLDLNKLRDVGESSDQEFRQAG